MTGLPPAAGTPSPRPGARRVVLWIAVGAIGLFLLVSGILGIIAKG